MPPMCILQKVYMNQRVKPGASSKNNRFLKNQHSITAYRDCCKKKVDWLFFEILQFLPNQADIQAILLAGELVISSKFHDNWIEILDFSKKLTFGQSTFFATISMLVPAYAHAYSNH